VEKTQPMIKATYNPYSSSIKGNHFRIVKKPSSSYPKAKAVVKSKPKAVVKRKTKAVVKRKTTPKRKTKVVKRKGVHTR